MKKIIWIVIIFAFLSGGYVLYILKSEVTLNEPSPLDVLNTSKTPEAKDAFDSMSKEEKEQFMSEVEAMRDVVVEKDESMPETAAVLAQGDFKPRFHSVEGHALLIAQGDKKILRFEDFKTDNGPNLHIYLSSDLGNDDFVDLDEIRATQGSVNYEVPSSVDIARYRYVLVWCVPFGILFSYAELLFP